MMVFKVSFFNSLVPYLNHEETEAFYGCVESVHIGAVASWPNCELIFLFCILNEISTADGFLLNRLLKKLNQFTFVILIHG